MGNRKTCNDVKKGDILFCYSFGKVYHARVKTVKKDGLMVSARYHFDDVDSYIPYSTLIVGHKNGNFLVGDDDSCFYVEEYTANYQADRYAFLKRAEDVVYHLKGLKINVTIQSQELIKKLES